MEEQAKRTSFQRMKAKGLTQSDISASNQSEETVTVPPPKTIRQNPQYKEMASPPADPVETGVKKWKLSWQNLLKL